METISMTIKQALKAKNQLVSEIQELTLLIRTSNSIIVGNKRDYEVSTLMMELDSKILDLINLKAKIQRANTPVLEKIYLLSELKNKVNAYKSIDTSEGRQINLYGNPSEAISMEVELSKSTVRGIIKGIESEIIEIQDALDTFNAVTYI